MARFLSPDWFEQVVHDQTAVQPDAAAGERLVICQVVRDAPGGEVRYHVVVEAGRARIIPPQCDAGPADLTITSGWETAVAIAQGKLAAQTALVEGKLRIKGNLAGIAAQSASLAGLDPVPAAVRRDTTY